MYIEFRDIENYEGLYKISNDGSVYSCRRKRILNHRYKNIGGYDSVMLCKNGNSKQFIVHRLVAMAFIPNPLNKPEINHIDGNKQNNNVSNLEWCTAKENTKHAFDCGIRTKTWVTVYNTIGDKIGRYYGVREAGRILNIAHTRIKNNIKYKNLIFKYE